MSSLIVWPLFLIVSKPNVCQVPASIFCLFHSNSAQNFSNEKGVKPIIILISLATPYAAHLYM